MKLDIGNYKYSCLNDARDILKSIGMPERLYNPRCVMVLCACAEMTAKDTKWRKASENYHTTKEMIQFINNEFPNKAGLEEKGYAPNSRETVRKATLKPWICAGIVETKPGLSPNDKDFSYRFTSRFAALLRTYNTAEWKENLKDYNETHKSYKDILKQEKEIIRDYVVDYCNIEIELKKNPHNKLQMNILQQLIPLISPNKPELLYIGDTADRFLIKKDERLREIGIDIFSETTTLPDIVLYDEKLSRILFIEAYYSGGAFSIDRVNAIKNCCHCKEGTEVAFITAFDTTNKMLKAYKEVAWDTDMWSADEPTHLTHKNGDHFIGRKL